MKDYEKLLELFSNYLKEVENEQLQEMANGIYIFVSWIINLSYRDENEELFFKPNSFAKKMKNTITKMELLAYEELEKRNRGK